MTTSTSIKITNLVQSTQAGISYNTLVPVVTMTGVPTTVSANLQVIGNMILSGAGGTLFSSAANAIHAVTSDTAQVAMVAGTVTAGDQPNITSTGVLQNVSISSSVILPANITITGSSPVDAIDHVIAFKIPIVIRGVTYYMSLTANI